MSRQNSTGGWIVAVIVVVGVVVAGVYLARQAIHPDVGTSTAALSSAQSSAVPASADHAIEHPISQAAIPAESSTEALPSLENSDASVAAALLALVGGDDPDSLLIQQQIIPHIVATIDSLPRRGLSNYTMPTHSPKGNFITDSSDAGLTMSDRNAQRYAPYMQVMERVDAQKLAGWYVHVYPLFQDAYRQLGYPKGYFNDRLIVVIDNLLAAPDLAQPAMLVPSKSSYAFADPSLEALSAGQKLMLRVGPSNEAKIKDKLREIRASLIGQSLPPASAKATR